MIVLAMFVVGCTGAAVKSKALLPNYEPATAQHGIEGVPLIYMDIWQKEQNVEDYSLILPYYLEYAEDGKPTDNYYFKPLYIVVN